MYNDERMKKVSKWCQPLGNLLYMHVYLAERYCHEAAVCGIEVCVM